MPQEMLGTRIQYIPGIDPSSVLRSAGDYCGPDDGRYSAGIPSVWFLLPIARDTDAKGGTRSVHRCASPPHVFIEEPNGSLTIRESIGAYGWNDRAAGYVWHGFLTEGRWELNKSKP